MHDEMTAELAAQAEFLQAVGSLPRVHLPVVYAPDGSFSVGTLSDGEWTTLTGMPWSRLYLDPALLNRLSQALPSLTWTDGELAHLLGVTEQLALGQMWVPNLNWEDVFTLVRSLLPVVQSTEFDLTVSFPPSPDAAVAASR